MERPPPRLEESDTSNMRVKDDNKYAKTILQSNKVIQILLCSHSSTHGVNSGQSKESHDSQNEKRICWSNHLNPLRWRLSVDALQCRRLKPIIVAGTLPEENSSRLEGSRLPEIPPLLPSWRGQKEFIHSQHLWVLKSSRGDFRNVIYDSSCIWEIVTEG